MRLYKIKYIITCIIAIIGVSGCSLNPFVSEESTIETDSIIGAPEETISEANIIDSDTLEVESENVTNDANDLESQGIEELDIESSTDMVNTDTNEMPIFNEDGANANNYELDLESSQNNNLESGNPDLITNNSTPDIIDSPTNTVVEPPTEVVTEIVTTSVPEEVDLLPEETLPQTGPVTVLWYLISTILILLLIIQQLRKSRNRI